MLNDPISGSGTGESIRDTKLDNLYIGWDQEDGFVFLFTPDMKDTGNHYHIALDEKQATKLARFLNKSLGELAVEHFSERAKRGNWEEIKKILANAPDVEPDPEDRL